MGAHHQKPDHQRCRARGQHRQGQRPPQADRLALWREKSQRIPRQAKVGRVTQRHQAGHALQQIQAHGKNRHDHHARHHLDVEVGADKREGGEGDQAKTQHELNAARQYFQV